MFPLLLGFGLGLAALATGCIDTGAGGTPLPPMCEVNADCDSGELCDEGVCWGDPPEGTTFAAVLVPPEDRDALVPTEIAALEIDDEGRVRNLAFAETVTITGRVVLAVDPTQSVAAQIKIRRSSRIPGGPVYTRTVIAQPGLRAGEAAFSITVPRLGPAESPYEMTIIPDDGTLAEPGMLGAPADLAPPIKLTLDGTRGLDGLELSLGAADSLKKVVGRVVDAANRGLAGMKVTALGRWDPELPPERASSRATTDAEGNFAIWIPTGMEEQLYELVVRPATGVIAPTLRKQQVPIPDPVAGETFDLGTLAMPSFPSSAPYVIQVRGDAPEGGVVAVEGAEVALTTALLPEEQIADNDGLTAFFTATGVTDAQGNVTLDLIPGGTVSRPYAARVQPPSTSVHGAVHAQPVLVGPPGANTSVLAPVTLDRRIPVTGTLVSDDGVPIANAAVTASAAAIYRWSLDLSQQAELDDFRFPTATTDDGGGFVIWLDDALLGAPAAYDLQLIPPAEAQAPRWSLSPLDVTAQATAEGVLLGEIALPPAAYVRGQVTTREGDPVPGAEVKVYEVATDLSVCQDANFPFPTEECHPPAVLRHVTRSDDSGRAILVLPDPR